jgi:outer membrane lipoprotein-sorting protein
MKKLLTIISLLAISTWGLQAQDLQEVLDNYFETIGQKNYLKHETMMAKGKSIQQGMETDFTIYQKRPDKFRLEVDIQGATMLQAFDGEKGWYTAPWTGSTDPVELAGFQLESMKRQADFDGMLYNYEEKGFTTELVGTEDMEGTEVFKIKQTDEDGNTFYHFLDADNYVLLKTTAKIKAGDSEIESETLFSNYKEKDGMILPFSMESRMNGQTVSQINMEEMTFDVEVTDDKFAMPEKKEPAEEPEKNEEKEE